MEVYKLKKNIVVGAIIIAGSLIVVGGSFFIEKNNFIQVKNAKPQIVDIKSREKVFINGKIIPKNSETIYIDSLKGKVHEVKVENGQSVQKGEVLFTYKNEQITEQIAQIISQKSAITKQKKGLLSKKEKAEKELASNKAELNKEDLLGKIEGGGDVNNNLFAGIESQIEAINEQIDTTDTQITSLDEQLKALKEKEYYSVESPNDGNVILKDEDKNPGAPFMIIEDSKLYVRGIVGEKELLKLDVDQVVEINVLPTNKTLKGKISFVDSRPVEGAGAAAMSTGGVDISSYEVRIELDSQEGATNGFHIQAIAKLSEDIVKVPKKAIISESGKHYVFKNIDNKLVKVEVKYEDLDNEEVRVIEGIKEEEQIVTNPSDNMKEGDNCE